jgi:predicted anti-sigma-YlaC factor YlaD
MSCDRHRPVLMDVALGAPAPSELAAHLARCGACRATLDQEQQLVGRMDAEVEAALHVQPGAAFLPHVRQRVAEAPPAARRWLLLWPVPAAIGLLLVSRILIRETVTPAPAPVPAVATEMRRLPLPGLTPAPLSPRAARVAAVRAARDRRTAVAEPEVLIPPAEREALRRYIRDLHARRVDSMPLRMVGFEASGLRRIEMPLIDLAPIRIALIGVQPLTMESPNEE